MKWNIGLRVAALIMVLVTANDRLPAQTIGDYREKEGRVDVAYKANVEFPEGLTIIYNGARLSKILPCGCKDRNLGGIDREAGIINAIREATSTSLMVDAGGFFREFVDAELRLQTWYLLEGLKKHRLSVMNVGYTDFRHGLEPLRKLQKAFDLPLISANIVDMETKQPLFDTSRTLTLELPNGQPLRVGFTGVTAENGTASHPSNLEFNMKPTPILAMAPGEIKWTSLSSFSAYNKSGIGGASSVASAAGGESNPAIAFALDTTTPTLVQDSAFEVVDEVQAVTPIAEELRNTCDIVILLCYNGPARTKVIAEAVPFIDAVISGDSYLRYDSFFFGPNNNILWTGNEHEGRFVGKLEFAIEADGTIRDKTGELIPVDQNIIPDSEFTKIIEAFKADAKTLPLPPGQKLPEKPYVGANRCNSCHSREFAEWQATPHSKAMLSLVKRDQQLNPDCAKCHSVAFGKPGGFSDLRVTPFLANVQCESCHGPAKDHIAEEKMIEALPDAEKARVVRKSKMNMRFDAQMCVECHDAKNDANFNFAHDLKLVDHINDIVEAGREKDKPEDAVTTTTAR